MVTRLDLNKRSKISRFRAAAAARTMGFLAAPGLPRLRGLPDDRDRTAPPPRVLISVLGGPFSSGVEGAGAIGARSQVELGARIELNWDASGGERTR